MKLAAATPIDRIQPSEPIRLARLSHPAAGFAKTLANSVQDTPKVFTPDHYVVKAGDTLSAIVSDFLKSQGSEPSLSAVYSGVATVAKANDINDPDLIQIGQHLDLSALLESRRETATLQPRQTAVAPLPAAAPSSPGAPAVVETAATGVSTAIIKAALPVQAAADRNTGLKAYSIDITQMMESMLTETNRPASPWAGVLEDRARLTSEFGMRRDPFTGRMRHHAGIDLAAEEDSSIYAFKPGRVVESGWKSGYGNMVRLRHADGTETVYAHNAANMVRSGETVAAGEVIGLVGSTGRSTGPHLHFEVRVHNRAVDPIPYLRGQSRTLMASVR